ncbi:DNA repair protein, SNF2 family [Gigaspora rosea]|uniref:DNA repair protein, SNF2 family n=1 Tax=Gigaspora rosea TaxID=44941 RepID=A0A397VMU2_9GLOM|nr:DNA repair protein, SNF2 family [Gigaspora rosea]
MLKSRLKLSFKPPSKLPLNASTNENIPNTSREKQVKSLISNPSKRIKVNDDSAGKIYNSEESDDDENRTRKIPQNCSKDFSDTSPIGHNWILPAPSKILLKPFKVPTFTKKPPFEVSQEGTQRRLPCWGSRFVAKKSLFDPNSPDAIVLYDPKDDPELEVIEEDAEKNKINKTKTVADILGIKNEETKKVHVVVDPVLAKKLRPHQVEGVKFLYNCTTGRTVENAYGCIMADEMGLGKTLQCITLLWTLLKQSPDPGKGTIEKCIIVCPSSLVHNWANELEKWLGPIRLKALVMDSKGKKENLIRELRKYAGAKGKLIFQPVLIVSYETLRINISELKTTQFGLLLCDEGHRLKNSNSQLFQALNSLQVQRRVILSGTPIQNDLSEYFSLLNFANPNLLGTPNEFRKNYENPILRGRDAEASEKEREISDQKLSELLEVVSKFIIRRNNDLLSKYLPVKYEHVVFCRLSEFQMSLYNLFLNSPEIQDLLRSQPLKAIIMLKKLCNHPDLLDLTKELKGSQKLFPPEYAIKERSRKVKPEFSGKMTVLDRMLSKIKNETNDKIVLISNYTQTLDMFEQLCRNKKYGFLRLDGTMPIKKRQTLVNRFNDPRGSEFVFLLSSKAGGCGLNLIGANRLVLFDPDWNPASDQQALARIWRDGQKKNCFIYRFISTGSIEEKVFQRQSHKQSLSSCIVDEEEDVMRHYTYESLRRLFFLNPDTICDTHDTFKCLKCVKGVQRIPRQPGETMNYNDTSSWDHFTGGDDMNKIHDNLLKAEANQGLVSYVFQYISH